jgi:peptidyl-prolyl cis-trans isomerase SurA
MGLKRFSTGTAMAAILAAISLPHDGFAQSGQPAAPVAGAPNPAAEDAPQPRAAPQAQLQLSDGIVATVNDAVITGFDLRQSMLLLIAMTQVQPSEENLPAIQQQALNQLIEKRLKDAEIAKFPQLQISDEEVNQEIAQIARDAGASAESYLAFLQQAGIQTRTLQEQIRTEIAWSALVRGRFRDRARVSRSQVEQTLRQLAEAAAKPQYLIGEIYIESARVGGQQAAMDGARQLVQQIIQGAPFQAVARQFSSAPSAMASTPGDAGWIVQGTVQPALQAAFDVLEVGQLSNPIAVEGGVYIIYMRDKRDGSSTNLVQMKQVMIELPETASEQEVAAATASLEAIRGPLTCDNIIERSRATPGLLGADLGESDVSNLAPQFQQVARAAEIGAVSSPVRTPLGVHLLAVCGRRLGGPDAPSYAQVENRLQSQQFSMLDRRYSRDLREDALIELK